MSEERGFKGIWIPAEVWFDSQLSPLDKIILAEIDSLDVDDHGCYASNEHIAQFCQCSERKVSDSISRLKKMNYIEQISFDGRTRLLRSSMAKTAMRTHKICYADTQNLLHSNIDSNIDSNIYVPKDDKNGKFCKPSVEDVAKYIAEKHLRVDAEVFVDYYESNGWKVGRNPMKDWKAAVRTWSAKEQKNKSEDPPEYPLLN